MTSATAKRYCWTCRTAITPSRWARHIKSIGHVRRATGDPPPFVQPQSKGQPDAEDEPEEGTPAGRPADEDDDGEPDTRTPCGGCSRRITPGSEYWRSDGRCYHVNCVPLATTRRMNPTQTAQAGPQQPSTLLAGVGLQLGAGTDAEAHPPTPAKDDQGKPECPLVRAARERREARARNG